MDSELAAFAAKCVNTTTLNLIVFLFFQTIYNPKYKNKFLYIISLVGAIIIMMMVNSYQLPVLNFIYFFISSNVICILLFKAKIKQILLCNTTFAFMMLFSDILSVLFFSLSKNTELKTVISNSQYLIISYCLNILLMFLCFRVTIMMFSKREIVDVKYKEASFLIIMTFFEVFITYNFNNKIKDNIDAANAILMLIGFIILNICVVFFIQKIACSYRYQYEISLIEKQNKIQLSHYREINRNYQLVRKTAHDINKHLQILSALEIQNKQKADEYRSMISNQVDSLFFNFNCTNQILSVVLSQKIAEAEKEDIEVNTNVEDIIFEFMDDMDITALFANLWDDAIESCKKAFSDRIISFTMRRVNGFVVINMEYTCEEEVYKRDKIISFNKKQDEADIAIINSTVEKYMGIFVTKCSKGIFRAEITIPVPFSKNSVLSSGVKCG